MKIPFAKPQINRKEIENVFETLKSGIFVHGNKTKKFAYNSSAETHPPF